MEGLSGFPGQTSLEGSETLRESLVPIAWLHYIIYSDIQVHFFAHLTIARVISASSMIALLQSFTAVLEEFGVSHSRAKNAALCAAEGLMRVHQPYPAIAL